MSGEPFPGSAGAEFPFAEGFSDEPVLPRKVRLSKSWPLTRRKRVVAREMILLLPARSMLLECFGFIRAAVHESNRSCVFRLRTKDGSFQEPCPEAHEFHPNSSTSIALTDALPSGSKQTLTRFSSVYDTIISRLFSGLPLAPDGIFH